MGPQGPAGSVADAAIFVPFSIDSVTPEGNLITTDSAGDPSIIAFAGFGGSTEFPITLSPGDWAAGVINFSPSGANHYGASFIMPRNGILRSISMVFANRDGGGMLLPAGVTMRPFACVAVMAANSSVLVYNIIQSSITYTEPYIGTGTIIPKYSLRWGTQENLTIPLGKGSAVAIVIGWRGDGVTTEQATNASVSGSLYIE